MSSVEEQYPGYDYSAEYAPAEEQGQGGKKKKKDHSIMIVMLILVIVLIIGSIIGFIILWQEWMTGPSLS